MNKKFHISDILISLVYLIFFISIGLIFVINFRPLYYFDVNFLDIPSSSGLDKQVIINNYNALIDYCSPFYKGVLDLPDLPSSANGLQHFKEVKDIFVAFHIMGLLSFIVIIVIELYKRKKKSYGHLFTSSIIVLVLPIITALGILINFDAAFTLFHKIFFRNDYWIFSIQEDPIISILPSEFFMHCAIVIIVFIVVGSALLYVFYRLGKKREKEEDFSFLDRYL